MLAGSSNEFHVEKIQEVGLILGDLDLLDEWLDEYLYRNCWKLQENPAHVS